MLTSSQIRQQFIDFFVQKCGHVFVPSSSVVPHGDDTLLFANAGMNQFKPYFLGAEKPPHPRVANTQKCIRAGGKHNDLDDVGKDTYHHTFFEMLGNWSFGDYFKKDAIAWAWELLTVVWKLDPTRLHVTVFEGDPANGIPRDDEAAGFWKAAGVPPERIHLGNKKDNFWEMGSTGPCGPCTEVHYDRTSDKSGAKLVNQSSPDVIEIWNLVFIQFNRNEDQSLTPLPAQHVDTGMGFERITAILQGKSSNYDSDVFTPIMDAFGKLTGKTYGGKLDDMADIGFRVVADHLRMATFAITDGARPGAKKRDAVLRSVIRRAVRYGYQQFDLREPFLYKLVPVVVEQMGQAFPELKSNPQQVANIIRDEETSFYRAIVRGMKTYRRVADEAAANKKIIAGSKAADLQTTYGFPIDLTQQMALEEGLLVDMQGYNEAIRLHQQSSEGDAPKIVISAVQGELPTTDDSAKYHGLHSKGVIQAWVKENLVGTGSLQVGNEVALVLDKTNFYAEQGGQVGDRGWIKTDTGTFEVTDTQRLGASVLHLGRVWEGTVKTGQKATLEVHPLRFDTMRNHTSTHLMNWALREVLGEHVEQKGSLVDADKTRYDFTHDKPMTADEVLEVERLVNEKILADLPVTPVTMALAEAKQIGGVRAVFGEKYPDPVRVVLIGAEKPSEATVEQSVEFCGGTHLSRTSQACLFKIVGQEGVAKGVRRITAVTGPKALALTQHQAGVLGELTSRLNVSTDQLTTRVETLQDEIKKLQAQLKKGAASDLAGVMDKLLKEAAKIGDITVVTGEVPGVGDDAIRTQVDRIKQTAGSSVVVVGWVQDDKVGLLAAVSDDVVKKGVKAGDLVKEAAKLVGGSGGGRPNMAQAGGKDPAKLGEALALAKQLVAKQLGQG
jgi:alanyl-tRNA synthetase